MIWRGRDNSGQGAEADRGYGQPPPGPAAPPQQPGGNVGTRVESVLDAAERAAFSIREDAQVWASNYLEESRRKADEAAANRIREISELTDSLVSRARAVAQQSDELIAAMDEAGRRVVGAAMPGRDNDVGQHPGVPSVPQQPQPQVAAPAPPQPAPVQAAPPQAAPRPPAPAPQAQPPPATPPSFEPPPPQSTRAPAPPQPPRPEPPAPAAAAPPPAAAPPAPDPPQSPPASPASPSPAGSPPPGSPASSEGARLLATQMAVAGSGRDEIAWRLREEFGIQDSTGILDDIGI